MANHLSNRETQIAMLIVQEMLNKEIASELGIKEGTVKNHITNIIKKLRVNSRTGIAIKTIKSEIGGKMYCPMKFNNPNYTGEPCQCLQEECAWWNDYFGKCSVAVESYLKGIEDHYIDSAFMKGGY